MSDPDNDLRLKAAMLEIEDLIKRHDLAAVIVLGSQEGAFVGCLCPSWLPFDLVNDSNGRPRHLQFAVPELMDAEEDARGMSNLNQTDADAVIHRLDLAFKVSDGFARMMGDVQQAFWRTARDMRRALKQPGDRQPRRNKKKRR